MLGAGAEPLGKAGLPCIFDWTAVEILAGSPDPAPGWPPLRPQRFVVIASQRGLEKIPQPRIAIWDGCRTRSDFELDVAPPGWRMAGIIRERQVQHGDILLVLGGGAGAEHLAELYRDEGKPVIPIWTELGAFNEDGSGGSRALHEQALDAPTKFFRLRAGVGSEAARLTSLRLTSNADPASLAGEVATLIRDLKPPTAFFVRLLDQGDVEYPPVERFFRSIVDHVVAERGYTPREMGRETPEAAFMNVEIFSELHRASLVIVDLTAMRPNCTMELGYALAAAAALCSRPRPERSSSSTATSCRPTSGKTPALSMRAARRIATGSINTASCRPSSSRASDPNVSEQNSRCVDRLCEEGLYPIHPARPGS